MSSKLGSGDLVVALRPGGQDSLGYPRWVPEPGQVYRLTSIYRMRYGLGCTLEGRTAEPYLGFLLYVKPGIRLRNPDGRANTVRPGWYFRRAQMDDVPAVAGAEWLRDLLKQKELING